MPGAPAFLSDWQANSAAACGHIQDYRPLKDPGSFRTPNPQLVAWVWALSLTPALHQVFLWPFRPNMLPLGWDRMVLSVGNVCWFFFFPLRFVHSIFCLNFSSLRGGLRPLPVGWLLGASSLQTGSLHPVFPRSFFGASTIPVFV